MPGFDTGLSRRPRAVGVRVAVVLLLVLVVGGAWVGAYFWLQGTGHLRPIERAVAQSDYGWPPWMGKGGKKATYMAEEPEGNHVMATAPHDAELRRLQQELDALRRQLAARPQPTPVTATRNTPAPPPTVKRPPMYFVAAERRSEARQTEAVYQTAPWTYIPCVLENVLHSEIEGLFTVRTTRPVWDATGQYQLIPQGQRIGAKDTTANLLFGNERIPAFALSVSMPDGSEVDLGNAPILDASGTNGLTGEVNNHTWRLVWTSVFIGGLQGGQQVLQTEAAGMTGAGPVAAGIARQGGSAAQMRLGRAQDTRPTVIVQAGERCNILVPKPLSLPAVTLASR